MSSYCRIGHLNHYYLHKMKNSVSVREYTHADYESVVNIWNILDMGVKERKDTKEIIHKTLDNNAKLFLLIKDEKVIGTSWITSDYRRLYLHHFGILTEHQGKGYANTLMDACMAYGEEQKMQIKLEVYNKNFRAINLYKKYGFGNLFPDYIIMILRKFHK